MKLLDMCFFQHTISNKGDRSQPLLQRPTFVIPPTCAATTPLTHAIGIHVYLEEWYKNVHSFHFEGQIMLHPLYHNIFHVLPIPLPPLY